MTSSSFNLLGTLAEAGDWKHIWKTHGARGGKGVCVCVRANTECVTKKKVCIHVSVCFLRPSRGGKFSRAIIRPQIRALLSQNSPLLGPPHHQQQHNEDSTKPSALETRPDLKASAQGTQGTQGTLIRNNCSVGKYITEEQKERKQGGRRLLSCEINHPSLSHLSLPLPLRCVEALSIYCQTNKHVFPCKIIQQKE